MKTAIVSGTFDPITVGHLDVIVRASKLFDQVVVAVSSNSEKKGLFSDEARVAAAKASVEGIENCSVALCEGLLAEFCKRYENPVIVRGARTGGDFDYERSMFVINKELASVDTVIFPCESGMDHISSTYVRELIKYGKDISNVVPLGAKAVIEDYFSNEKH